MSEISFLSEEFIAALDAFNKVCADVGVSVAFLVAYGKNGTQDVMCYQNAFGGSTNVEYCRLLTISDKVGEALAVIDRRESNS